MLSVALAASARGTAPREVPDTLCENQIVVALGNSITELGDSPHGYVTLMRRVLQLLAPQKNIIIVNSGISGHKATDMAERFDRDVVAYQPDWVTISVGINDVWHGFDNEHPLGDGPLGVPLPLFKEKVVEMVEKAHAHGIRVALFTTTVIKENLDSPENKKLRAYNDALRTIASSHDCLLVDQNAAFHKVLLPLQRAGMPEAGAFTIDGVHMIPSGDWLMARTALEAFGISGERLDQVQKSIDRQIDADENSWDSGADRNSRPRTLIFGAPDPRDGFLEDTISDRCLSTALFKNESTRQLAARCKLVMAERPFTHAVVLVDGCSDLQTDGHGASDACRKSIGKILSLGEQKRISMAFLGPSCADRKDESFAWLADSCRVHGAAYSCVSDPAEPFPVQVARWMNRGMETPSIGFTSGNLFMTRKEVMLYALVRGGEIHFTLDGSEPLMSSPVYTTPLTLTGTTTIKARVWYGRNDSSGVRTEEFEKATFLPPVSIQIGSPGLQFAFYKGEWTQLPSFDSLQPSRSGVAGEVDVAAMGDQQSSWGAVLSGYLEIPRDDIYSFLLTSDDGSRLFLDGRLVVDNDGLHGPVTEQGKIALAKGPHAVRLLYFQGGGGQLLRLQWQTEGGGRMDIPASAYSH